MKIILLFKFKLRYKNQWWFGTKLPPNIHTMTVQDILQRKLDPSFRKSIVATIRSWQWPKESNHQNHSSYNYQKLLRIPHKPLNRFEAERENSLWTCWKSTHSSLWPLSSYTKSLLLVRLSYVTFSSAIGPRGSRAFLKDKLAPETSCNQAWWSALPSAFWTLAKRYLRSVLRKLTRYRTTQCLWLALVKRKS